MTWQRHRTSGSIPLRELCYNPKAGCDKYPTRTMMTICKMVPLTAAIASARPTSVSGCVVTISITLPANVGCALNAKPVVSEEV